MVHGELNRCSLMGRLRRDLGLRSSRIALRRLRVVVTRSLEAGSRIDGGT